jgi:hypothetical protein
MQDDPLNVFTQKDPEDAGTGLQPALAPTDFFLFGYSQRKLTE